VRKTTLLALSVCLFLPAAGAALPFPQPPAAVPSADLERLVEQLGDSDYRKRDEAGRLLEAEGARAIPVLRKALGHRDAEVRKRAHELLPAIETALFVAPRRVTLDMTDKPLRAVFDEITRQTGYKIEFWSANAEQNYTFAFKDLTFWEALDRVCMAGKLVVQNYGDERILLQQQGGHSAHVHHWGAFRFVPVNFQHYRQLNFGLVGVPSADTQRSESLTLSFLVCSEPRLPILGMGEVQVTAAYDSEKNSMLLPSRPGMEVMLGMGRMGRRFVSRYGNGNKTCFMQTQVTLNRPSSTAGRIRELRGNIPVNLLVEQRPVVLTDKFLTARGKKVEVGTTRFILEDVTAQPNGHYQLKLTVMEDSKDNPHDYTWANSLYQRLELHDEDGNKYAVFGSGWSYSGPNHVQITFTYGSNGAKIKPPSKFIFHDWKTLSYLVPFEFKDLPLP
jgi:hypothetical protein